MLNQELPHATPHSPTPAVCQRAFLQSGSHTETGDTTFYSFDTFNGSKQSTGRTDFYTISDGSSTTRNSVGNNDFYPGSRPSLSGDRPIRVVTQPPISLAVEPPSTISAMVG